MPFDVAFSLPPDVSAAWAITFSGFHGKKFNYDRWEFEDDPK